MPSFGYAGNILRVDLSSGKATTVPTIDYATNFLGGRGSGAKVYVASKNGTKRGFEIVYALKGMPLLPGGSIVISPCF